MSSFGFGPSKKGRTADSSMMTRNVRITSQGAADATYASNPKKNPFRLSTAILNGYQYGGETIADTNNGVLPASPAQVEDSEPETFPNAYDLFSPFSVSDWRLNNGYSSESTSPVGITMMTDTPFAPNPGSPRSSSFYTKYVLDLTKSFTLITTFLTKNVVLLPPPAIRSVNPPLDGFAVAFSADPRRFGGNGGGVGLLNDSAPFFGASTYPVVLVRIDPLAGTTSLATANTSGTAPSGSAVVIPSIATNITNQNNLNVNVTVTYNATTNTLSWIIDDGISTPVSNEYTGVDLYTLLGVNNGYVGVGAGAGGKIQPVYLTGMTYTQQSFVNLFSTFNSATWTLNGDAQGVFLPSPGAPSPSIQLAYSTSPVTGASTTFNDNAIIDVTHPFAVTETFNTKSAGTPPMDGFCLAFSTSKAFVGAGGSSLAMYDSSQAPITTVGVAVRPREAGQLANAYTQIVLNTSLDQYLGSRITNNPSLSQISTDITNIDTQVKVSITYDGSSALFWSVSEGVYFISSRQTGINLQTLLGSSTAYLGATAGSGGRYQPVYLTGTTYQTYA